MCPMDPSTTFTLTQMILAWTLLGILLVWMISAAVLALRGLPGEKLDMADMATPSRSFPAISTGGPLHKMTSARVETSLGTVHDTFGAEPSPIHLEEERRLLVDNGAML